VPRAGLTREAVVAEAARIVDEVGYERLTLAAVASRFGVAVPSLYKHVDGLPALRRELALVAVRELGLALTEEVANDPDRAFAAMSYAYREFARAHPGRYVATLRAPDPEDEEARAAADEVLGTVLSVLGSYGLSGSDAVDAARTLRSALHGFVSLEAIGGFGLPVDVDRSFERLVEIVDGALRTWRPAARRGRRTVPVQSAASTSPRS
jgi:AcrR family transcriptional regulator